MKHGTCDPVAEMSSDGSGETRRAPQLSIVVPTYKECENIPTLIERVFAAVCEAGIATEMILVDDNSQDGSAEAVRQLESRYPVRMIVRTTERGLSTAVLRGFEEAAGEMILVMDADLSHPPQRIPALIGQLSEGADFVIGSRYAEGGQTTEDWGLMRKINSLGATLLARPLTAARDPMAGFFCLHRKTWQNADPLNPLGYKIGLELMIKGRCQNVREVPIVFQDRHAGKSKMTFRQQLLYLMHLKRLYAYKYPTLTVLVLYVVPLLIVAGLVLLLLR